MTPGKDGARYFGHGLPYTDIRDLKGTLITLEGTDGVGRSTQGTMCCPLTSPERKRRDTGALNYTLAST